MKISKESRRGLAIELAIFALAVTTVFCAIAVSVTLSETKYIKAELSELDGVCERLEYEKTNKATFERVLRKGFADQGTNPMHISGKGCDVAVRKIYDFETDSNKTLYKIESWTWLNEEK